MVVKAGITERQLKLQSFLAQSEFSTEQMLVKYGIDQSRWMVRRGRPVSGVAGAHATSFLGALADE
jgi:hypothetical protein